jgi:hypothetical protein
MTRDDLMSVATKIRAIHAALGTNGSHDIYYWIEQAATIFDLAKWKVDDRVELATTPDINEKESWGWMGYKHFLIEGAKATVRTVEFQSGHFQYALRFDDDSWIDHEGVRHPAPEPLGVFYFWESKLRAARCP